MKISDEQRDAIVEKFAEGEVVYEHREINGDFQFCTEKQGFFLIRDGVNILSFFQIGKVYFCLSFPRGSLKFITIKQRCVHVTKSAIDAKLKELSESTPSTPNEYHGVASALAAANYQLGQVEANLALSHNLLKVLINEETTPPHIKEQIKTVLN